MRVSKDGGYIRDVYLEFFQIYKNHRDIVVPLLAKRSVIAFYRLHTCEMLS